MWKIAEKNIKKPLKTTSKDLTMPKVIILIELFQKFYVQMQIVEKGAYLPNLKVQYPNLHNYSINSISLS